MPDGSHILIVGDETVPRLALQHSLQRSGFQVTTARHGLEALECWRQYPADAVITDLRMPHLPGHAALPHLFYPFFTTKPPSQGCGLGL